MTRKQVAERYGIPEATLAQWASRGTGPRYARFGRHARYNLVDLTAWEQTQIAN
ncbi:MAG: helix-turn-helix transcriptional regulator [Mycobacterium sp.]